MSRSKRTENFILNKFRIRICKIRDVLVILVHNGVWIIEINKLLLYEWSKISRLWTGRFIVLAYQIGKLPEGLFVSQAWPGFVLTFPASWVQFSSTRLVHVVCSHLIIAGSLFRCGSQSFTSQVRVYSSFEAHSVYECQCVHTFTITVCQLYVFERTDFDFSIGTYTGFKFIFNT